MLIVKLPNNDGYIVPKGLLYRVGDIYASVEQQLNRPVILKKQNGVVLDNKDLFKHEADLFSSRAVILEATYA